MKFSYVILPFLIAGCVSNNASKVWIGDGKSIAQTTEDYSRCKRQAHKILEPKYVKYTTGVRAIEDPNNFRNRRDVLLQLTDLCMNKEGYARKA